MPALSERSSGRQVFAFFVWLGTASVDVFLDDLAKQLGVYALVELLFKLRVDYAVDVKRAICCNLISRRLKLLLFKSVLIFKVSEAFRIITCLLGLLGTVECLICCGLLRSCWEALNLIGIHDDQVAEQVHSPGTVVNAVDVVAQDER